MKKYSFDSTNHIHKLGDSALIGTSTIASSVGKGSALIYWAVGMALNELGWSNPKKVTEQAIRLKKSSDVLRNLKSMSDETYLSLLDMAYKAHTRELKRTAGLGVDLHAELERYVKFQISGNWETPPMELFEDEELKKIIQPFVQWCENNVKKWLFSEVHVYSEELWTGGIIDAGYIDNNDEFVLADFKSGGAWLSGFIQLGGYARQLKENGIFTNNGEPIYITGIESPDSLAIFPFKGGFTEPVIIKGQTQKYMKGFECAVYNYKLQQEFEKR